MTRTPAASAAAATSRAYSALAANGFSLSTCFQILCCAVVRRTA
ncbi:hypothetical protein AMETH_2917 [Amycolatopsis methanolica 239]|uniref:Uncharacterized protein n=1 Tax=Amycolatopsis methanolica 239 TaxID=1068978 RepID=A0A076MQP7_AMYME|nr:hypothetical protein AMETH_2917 [Amycolatopsis methanolica 239]